jgi:pimeloyl-ACP methyl ester carboxylesterase
VARWWPIRYAVPETLEECNEEIMALKSELAVLDNEYDRVTAPVWVIQGEEDDLVQKENVDYLERKLGEKIVHIERIRNLNHFVPWKRPDLIKEAIRKISPSAVTKR